MPFNRRALCASLLPVGATLFAPKLFAAPNIPAGMLKIDAPFSPGGTADVLARVIAQKLNTKYGQSVVVENHAGMGGNLGAGIVSKGSADGSSLLLGTIGIHSAHAVYRSLPYNPEKDLQPVIILGGVPCAVVVNNAKPFKTLSELIAFAKKNPGGLFFGSAGTGSSTHMVGELFQQAAGVKLTHVPYKGSAAAMNDLIGGQIDMMFELLTTAGSFIEAGRIRALAVTSKNRSQVVPNVPTVSELAVPGFDGTGWFTIATSAKVPAATVNQLNKDINDILREPELQPQWKKLALDVMGGTAEQARQYVASETVKWNKVIETAQIKAE